MGLFVLLCLIIIPALIIPPWLASKGIEINAISGISFDKGLVVDEVSIAINKNAITFNKISLEYFEDKASAISDASWRLFSRQTRVRLAPDVSNTIKGTGINLGDLLLTDTAFNFTDLSEPYVFSAHTNQLETHLSDHHGNPVRQTASNIDLVLTTNPSLVISGFIQHGDLELLIPGDTASHRYPINFDNGNFSISWQPDITPLSVHIETLMPEWPTVSEGYSQTGKNIALQLDLNRAADTIKLSADRLWLDQPDYFPEFVRKPDNTHQGLHLGQAIANLSLLPLHQLTIKDFSYGNLIINSMIELEKPQHQAQQNAQTRLRLTGKALAPEPYDIDVLLKHHNQQDAIFTGLIAGPKGNRLQCRAKLLFVSPLPESLNCKADLTATKALTDRLKLYGIPSAALKQPLEITAKQTEIKQENRAIQATSPPVRNHLRDIALARYDIKIKLPTKIDLALNQFAVSYPVFSPAKGPPEAIDKLSLNSDGELSLSAVYQNNRLRFDLAEPTEELTIVSARESSILSLLIKQLHCVVRLDRIETPDSLQCHSLSGLRGKVKQLIPAADSKLTGVSLSSSVDLKWSASQFSAQFRQNRLTVDKTLFADPPNFIHGQLSELQVTANHINLQQTFDDGSGAPKGLHLFSSADVTLNGLFYGERLINNESLSEQERQQLLDNKHQLPVQKYNARLDLILSGLSMRQNNGQPKLNTNYQTTLNLKQNNQRLPPFSSKGSIVLTPAALALTGTMSNMNQALLMEFTVTSNFKRQNTRIKLHRNEITFNPKQTLKKYYLPHLPIDYNLTNGAISFDAELVLNKDKLAGEFSVFTKHLGGHIRGFHFADLNISCTAAITPRGIRTKHPIGLDIGLLHAGVLLENIYALVEFDTEANHYALHRASAYTLGGSISTHAITSKGLFNIDNIPIIVHQIDLAKLTQAFNSEDIELTGLLDGNFPLSIEDGFPVIRNGKLRSRYPGGILRYKEGSAIDQNVEAAGEKSMLVISRILKNYNYDSLSIDIDYSKEGQLSASSQFKGHNPDFQDGRPVYVNLSVEDNIPALIKTLNVINSSKLESLFLKQLGLDE